MQVMKKEYCVRVKKGNRCASEKENCIQDDKQMPDQQNV